MTAKTHYRDARADLTKANALYTAKADAGLVDDCLALQKLISLLRETITWLKQQL